MTLSIDLVPPNAAQRATLRRGALQSRDAQSASVWYGPGSAKRHQECRIASGTRLPPAESEIKTERERRGCIEIRPAIIVGPCAIIAAVIWAVGAILAVVALRACGHEFGLWRNGDHFGRRGKPDGAGVADRQQRHQGDRCNPGLHRGALRVREAARLQ